MAHATCYKCCDPELTAAVKGKDSSFEGMRFRAKIVDVYDGDTIRCVFRWNGNLLQQKIRTIGYDSPEMKPLKSAPDRDAEKKAAHAARDALQQQIGGQTVFIRCGGFDKYGRLLATIFKPSGWLGREDGLNVNQWMIDNHYGVPYGGGTKAAFDPKGTHDALTPAARVGSAEEEAKRSHLTRPGTPYMSGAAHAGGVPHAVLDTYPHGAKAAALREKKAAAADHAWPRFAKEDAAAPSSIMYDHDLTAD